MRHIIPGSFGDEIKPTAGIEKLENGFLITLVDMIEVKVPAQEITGAHPVSGETVTTVITGGAPPERRPRERKFMARDLEDVHDQLCKFFDGSSGAQPY